jgi:N-acetylglucosamine malate deacetylase 1
MMQQIIREGSRVLVLAPHTDDAELGCGGTIARLLRTGAEVHLAAFSTCEDSLPAGAQPTQLRDEFMDAMSSFGIPEENLSVFGFRVRHLSSHRQEVLEDIVRLRKQLDPDVVFLPSGSDLHQDHQVLFSEGIRAFKERTVWGYELPWNHIRFSAQAFVTLERADVEAKWNALKAYKSQLELKRPYFSWEFIEGLARMRGVQVKAAYAEAFEVVRIRW